MNSLGTAVSQKRRVKPQKKLQGTRIKNVSFAIHESGGFALWPEAMEGV